MVKIRKIIILLFCFSFSLFSFGQRNPVKWGKINQEEIDLKECENEPEASAIVLSDFYHIYFDINRNYYGETRDLRSHYERHFRIKILKEEGLKYVTFKIPYFSENKYEEILSIKAHIINPTSVKKPEIIKLSRKNMKTEIINADSSVCSFTLNEAKVGSIIEVSYTILSYDLVNLDTWNFQWDIPVKQSQFYAVTPDCFNYMISVAGKQNFSDTIYQSSFQTLNMLNARIACNEYGFKMKNIPSRRQYPCIPNSGSIYTINFQLLSAIRPDNFMQNKVWDIITHRIMLYTDPDNLHRQVNDLYRDFYPGGYIIYGFKNWDSFTKMLLKSEKFGKRYLKVEKYHQILEKQIVADSMLSLVNIYNFIRKNIRWNKQYSMFANFELQDVFDKKTGNSAEINMVLLSSLKRFGIKAFPLIISTRGNGTFNTTFPSLSLFNHTLVLAQIGNSQIVLDATDSLRAFNQIPVECSNRMAYVVRENSSGWVSIPKLSGQNKEFFINLSIDDSLKIKGIENCSYSGLSRNALTIPQNNTSNVIRIDSMLVINQNEDYLPLQINTKFELQSLVKKENNIYRFNPYSIFTVFENIFEKKQLKCFLNLEYPNEKKYTLQVDFSKKFTITMLPQDFNIALPNALGNFSISCKAHENIITYTLLFKSENYVFDEHICEKLIQINEYVPVKLSEEIFFKDK